MSVTTDRIKEKLGCTETLLAGMLEMTHPAMLMAERNVGRIKRLDDVIRMALGWGVPNELLFNLLSTFLKEGEDDSGTLMGLIIEETPSEVLSHWVEEVAERFI